MASVRNPERSYIYIETESIGSLIERSKGVYSALGGCPLHGQDERIGMDGRLKRTLFIGSWSMELPDKWVFMTKEELES